MASEFSDQLVPKVFRFAGFLFNDTETNMLKQSLDAELQDVRTVLLACADRIQEVRNEIGMSQSRYEQLFADERRTRALLKKLEIK